MHSIVCVKEIPDPETPASAFAIDPAAKRAIPAKDKPPVISPFDEQAVEAALRIKDAKGGKVTVISMGAPSTEKILKHTEWLWALMRLICLTTRHLRTRIVHRRPMSWRRR